MPAAAAAPSAPSEYKATTDRDVHPKPALPKLGPAGTTIIDPTFGCRILRVTDGDTNPDFPGLSYMSPPRTNHNPFNCDNSKFYVAAQVGGNVFLFNFDAKKFSASPMKDARGGVAIAPLWSACFSHTDPNILYGTSPRGRLIVEYNIATGASTALLDLDTIHPTDGSMHSLTGDRTDTFFATAFGGIQDSHPCEAVYNRKTKQCTVLDVKNSKVRKYGSADFEALNIQLGGGIHSSELSADGRYVEVTFMARAEGGGVTGAHLIWDTKTGQVHKMPQDGGHSALGFGRFINQPGNGRDGYGWTIRPLDDLEHPQQLLTPRAGEPTWGDSHPSWNNARPDKSVPFVTECYLRDGSVKAAWDEEIVAVSTDGTDRVWRFCHHRSGAFETEFWNTPRASVSQDGGFAMFTSTWEGTLGDLFQPPGPARPRNPAQPPGEAPTPTRRDVFIVKLEQEAPAAK
jgi:hypothetical protein